MMSKQRKRVTTDLPLDYKTPTLAGEQPKRMVCKKKGGNIPP